MDYIQRMRNLREDHDMYARYERGANELPIRHLLKLCHYYQVSSDYFLGLSDIKTAHLHHDSKT